MPDITALQRIRIGIASPEDILGWSHGEVKKPETINYRTFKPERDGLFCERIFGPIKDWECHCGRYKKVKYKGIVCERCGVEVTRSRIRRERMGHIELAAPVVHVWFLKGVPSPIALILDLSPRDLEKVVYFGSFIIIDIDKKGLEKGRAEIEKAVEKEKEQIARDMEQLEKEILAELTQELEDNKDEYDEATIRERTKAYHDRIRAEQRDTQERLHELDMALELLFTLERYQLVEEDKYRAVDRLLQAVSRRTGKPYRSMLNASIGASAVKELLSRVNLDESIQQLREEVKTSTGQRRARAIKRLEIFEALKESKARPEWMVLDVLPVISPELRPMVQLDGGRFATSDLNDLYRRILNRNNRLKKIMEIRAPESIVNHEKRLLQESVDALIDNGRRSRPVMGSNNRPLKSLSDMLKGKEGRFRKNLLGKRVDYSGRAVIVVGPHLKLHQCGLPKEMALELFKPYVMKVLVQRKITQNLKTAKKLVDQVHPLVWDALEEAIKDHPVLLNRAPTLHRFGIQAFEPVLVDGKAIQIHPMVCPPYNADFDGDQMAVHVPLSAAAQAEARVLMLSTNNLFSPANGQPTMTPMQDIVLGLYGLTLVSEAGKKQLEQQIRAFEADPIHHPPPRTFASPDEAISLALHPDPAVRIPIHYPVRVRLQRATETLNEDGTRQYETVIREMTPGQMIFHEILPEPLRYSDEWIGVEMKKKNLTDLIRACKEKTDTQTTVELMDRLKDLGFEWATRLGFTIALSDVDPQKAPVSDLPRLVELYYRDFQNGATQKNGQTKPSRATLEPMPAYSELLDLIDSQINEAKKEARSVRHNYDRGLIARNERDRHLLRIWSDTFSRLSDSIIQKMGQFNPLRMMVESGARGSREQLVQLMATRGMFRNNFNQPITDVVGGNGLFAGSRVMEYFVSMYGTRKGVTDTALLMGYSGFIARRLVDVAHDVVIKAEDCGTTSGTPIAKILYEGDVIEKLSERVRGRTSGETLKDPFSPGEPTLIQANEVIDDKLAERLDEIEAEYEKRLRSARTLPEGERETALAELTAHLVKCGFKIGEHQELRVQIRSPLTCELERGICAKCYGWDLALNRLVEVGTAVGVIAAETMSEPLSQLTMRTFHHGGIATGSVLTGYNQAGRMYGSLHEELKADLQMAQLPAHQLPDFVGEQQAVISAVAGKASLDPSARPYIPETDEAEEPPAYVGTGTSKLQNKQFARTLVEHSFYHYVGIPFVERLLEARRAPKGEAVVSRFEGKIVKIESGQLGRWVVIKTELETKNEEIRGLTAAEDILNPKTGTVIVPAGSTITKTLADKLARSGVKKAPVLDVILLPKRRILLVKEGDHVKAGDPLTQGPLDLATLLEYRGTHAVQEYMIKELQALYKANGVSINDRHLEIICRQMLRKVRIIDGGDTRFLPGQVIDRFEFRKENDRIRQMLERGEKIREKHTDPATGKEKEKTRNPQFAEAVPVIQGITEAALSTESFLSAASAQKTVRVLTEAAVRGKVDELVGLKENVIIGRLIPAGTGFPGNRNIEVKTTREPIWATKTLSALATLDETQVEEQPEELVDEESVGDIRSLARELGHEFPDEEPAG